MNKKITKLGITIGVLLLFRERILDAYRQFLWWWVRPANTIQIPSADPLESYLEKMKEDGLSTTDDE